MTQLTKKARHSVAQKGALPRTPPKELSPFGIPQFWGVFELSPFGIPQFWGVFGELNYSYFLLFLPQNGCDFEEARHERMERASARDRLECRS